MIDAFLVRDEPHVREYELAEPATATIIESVEGLGDPVTYGGPVTYTHLRIDIPPQWPHSITIPTVMAVGTGGEPHTGTVATYSQAVDWDDVLAALGLQHVPGDPPVKVTEPYLVGAVPTAADLPAEPPEYATYLLRDTNEGACWIGGGWVTIPWSPGCDELFCPAGEVPDAVGS